MNKTEDLEYSILAVLLDGRMCLEVLESHLPYVGDRRWIAVALMHLRQAGKIRYTSCDADHSHDGSCVVEAIA